MRDVGYTLAPNIADIKYDDIPEHAVDITKKTILDTLGVIIGGKRGRGRDQRGD